MHSKTSALGVKKILITDTDNGIINNEFTYILGFWVSLWGIILDKKEIKIILDGRYFWQTKNIDKAKLRKRIWENLKVTYIHLKWKLTDEILKQTKNSKIKLENNITLKYYEEIKKKHKWDIKISKPFFEKNRIIKQIDEIKYLKKAIQIIDKVWIEIEKQAKSWDIIWKTEAEVRAIIVTKILELWWEWESFEAIVAFWPNSAVPHHKAWETIIWNGPLLVDMWALYKWYCSDFTRTIWIWNPSPTLPLSREGENKTSPLTRGEWGGFEEFQKIYNSVKKAYQKALKYAKPWVKGKDIDSAARKSIEQDWYWKYFTHSTGHGVGLNIHEDPRISKKWNNTIKENMVFTIEPGIYLPWKFWVRLENIVFAQKNWVKCYSEIKL